MQQERVKPTLKRTKFACVNCKAAKAACDSNRPCAWCIRHALQDSCVDAPRKVRTSKKICCDPSLHSKNVVFKQEYKQGNYALALASDFTPTTAIPPEAPLSPPSEIFPIEDLLNPSFDFGPPSNQQPCSNCPLFHTCAKDAPQRLICATSASPPHSPLSEGFEDEPTPSLPTLLTPVSLSSHPDYCLQLPPIAKISTPESGTTPFSFSLQSTPSPSQYLTPQPNTPSPAPTQTAPSPPQTQVQEQAPSPAQVTQPRAASGGCCSFASSPHLPPLLDDVCNCQTLVQREMAKINASLETITALMQLQSEKVPLLPTATFNIPDTVLQDCNDEFAKALGYDGRDDLFATADVDALAISTQQMMKPSTDDEEDGATPKKHHKLSLTTLIPQKWVPGMYKCAIDLQKATLPLVNQLVFSSKRGETKYFTVLIKPCGWFAYISLLKQHADIVEGIAICGQ